MSYHLILLYGSGCLHVGGVDGDVIQDEDDIVLHPPKTEIGHAVNLNCSNQISFVRG